MQEARPNLEAEGLCGTKVSHLQRNPVKIVFSLRECSNPGICHDLVLWYFFLISLNYLLHVSIIHLFALRNVRNLILRAKEYYPVRVCVLTCPHLLTEYLDIFPLWVLSSSTDKLELPQQETFLQHLKLCDVLSRMYILKTRCSKPPQVTKAIRTIVAGSQSVAKWSGKLCCPCPS